MTTPESPITSRPLQEFLTDITGTEKRIVSTLTIINAILGGIPLRPDQVSKARAIQEDLKNPRTKQLVLFALTRREQQLTLPQHKKSRRSVFRLAQSRRKTAKFRPPKR